MYLYKSSYFRHKTAQFDYYYILKVILVVIAIIYHLVYKSPAYEALSFKLVVDKLIEQGYPSVGVSFIVIYFYLASLAENEKKFVC